MRQRGWSDEQGDRGGGMLTMVAQARANLADTAAPQQVEGGLAEQGHDRRPLPLVDRALVFAQGHILDAVQAILDSLSANDKTAGGAHRGRSARRSGSPRRARSRLRGRSRVPP